MEADESRILRARIDTLERALDVIETTDLAGGRAFAAKTVTLGAYPSVGASGKTFAMQATDVTGPEIEGGAATVTVRAGVFFAVNLGGGLPTIGTEIIVHETPGAHVFYFP